MGKKPDMSPSSVLATERRLPDGRRKINLRKGERKAIQRRRLVQAAVALFLDIEQHRTWDEIADELGLTKRQLKYLTKSAEFDKAYNDMLVDIENDPRFRAAQAGLADLLPLAVREHRRILSSDSTADGVKLRAIEAVYKLNGMREPDTSRSDREELVRFLKENGIVQEKPKVSGDFANAVERFFGEVVDGEFVDADDNNKEDA